MFPLTKTIISIGKAKLLQLLLASAAIAFLVIIGLMIGVTWISAELIKIEIGWLDTLVGWLVGILTGIGGWFILPALTVLIAGMFQETVIHRVEFIFYPDKVRTESPKFWHDIWHEIKFTGGALLLNIIILPFYLLGIGFIVSIFLNAYLIGRELFESVAGYHLGKPEAQNLWKQNILVIYFGGLIITLLALVPVLNLFIPIFAVVWMVHLYHQFLANVH